jgi:hypothetical protein
VSGGRRQHVLGGRGKHALFDGGERGVAEFAQEVVSAPAELARDREAGAVVVDPLPDLEVVGVVGRAGAGGALSGLEQRPAQHLRPLMREAARGAPAVRLPHGYVEPAVAHGVGGALEAPRVAELGEDRCAGERPDAVELGH